MSMDKVLGAVAAMAATAAPRALAANPGGLSPVDYAFIGQTDLGNQYQVDSGRLGETHAADGQVKAYAQLMVPSHVQVERKLDAVLHKVGATPPPTSLLQHSYAAMIAVLKDDNGPAFDREYERQQMNYQIGDDALYRWEIANGRSPDLVAFAKMVLPKIDDDLNKAKALQGVR